MNQVNLGKLTKHQDGYQVKFERVFHHPIEKVWRAVTDTKILKIWFTDIEMDFKVGGKMTIWFQDAARTATYGKIIEIDPPERFVFTWEDELAEWNLFAIDKYSCRLKLTYSKLSDEYAASIPGGFHVLLDQLETVLGGRTEPYPFGREEKNPRNEKIQAMYKEDIYKQFPELKKSAPIVVEKIYNAPVEKVWNAITDNQEMKKWYFTIPEFKAEPGFEFQFYGEGKQGDKFLHLCKVVEVVDRKKLSYTWRFDGYDGNSLVTFELFPEEEGRTRIKLTHEGLESFPVTAHNDFAKQNFMEGWTEIIGNILRNYVEKTNN